MGDMSPFELSTFVKVYFVPIVCKNNILRAPNWGGENQVILDQKLIPLKFLL
jgi:hypothetical protein